MEPGARLGSYRIVRPLGAGGMGEVWLAEHAQLGRRAAIKVLHPQYSMQPEIVQRFFNEARAATAIADPGIVQIFDFGNHTDGSAYLVMEMLDGESLDRRLETQGALPVGQALRLVRQVASSLAAAHARGIIHRDLKPENIYVVRDPEVADGERTKLLDFGIAKLTDEKDARWRTSTSAVMGTPMYMSPEQCRGAGEVDARADLYSLGCVLFHLLTRRYPFEAEGAGELIAMHLREPAPPPSKYDPRIPASVDAIVLRCLEKDPAKRYASGLALVAAIASVVEELAVTAAVATSTPTIATSPPPVLAAPTTLSGAASQHPTSPPIAHSRRRGWAIAGIGLVGATAIVLAIAQTSSTPARAMQPPDATLRDAVALDAPVDARADASIDASIPAPIDGRLKPERSSPKRTSPKPPRADRKPIPPPPPMPIPPKPTPMRVDADGMPISR